MKHSNIDIEIGNEADKHKLLNDFPNLDNFSVDNGYIIATKSKITF